MEAVFDYATIGIVITNNEGFIIDFNKQAEIQFEYTKDEIIGSKVEVLLPSKFHDKHEQHRYGFYQHPKNRVMGAGRDLYGRKKNGTEFPVEVSLSQYSLDNELYVVAFVVDITIRKNNEILVLEQKNELEQVSEAVQQLNKKLELKVEERTMMLKEILSELEKSKEELKDALEKEKKLSELKSRFVTMASHELRTPLSTILTSLSLIDKYTTGEDQSKRERHIMRSKGAVNNMKNILDDFLSLNKLEEGKVIAHFSDFDIRENLENIIEEMKSLSKAGQQFIYQHQNERTVWLAASLFKNIMINLLSNAIKFSPENSVITINSFVDEKKIRISVKDEGIGISEEDLQHLSERFFRGGNALNIQGTGLGLHIVTKYLELMKGSLQCISNFGKGTEFIVLFDKL